jgi:thiol-disulfide isomerase/thioredoxin
MVGPSACIQGGDGIPLETVELSVDGACDGGPRCLAPGDSPGTEVGLPMADPCLKDQNGEVVHLYDSCGKVTLVGIGASWCQPCREEQPEFARWYEEIGPDHLSIYFVLFQDFDTSPASRSTVRDWLEDLGSPYPVVADPLNRVKDSLAPGSEVPVTVLLDRSMRIRTVGRFEIPVIRAKLDELLAE